MDEDDISLTRMAAESKFLKRQPELLDTIIGLLPGRWRMILSHLHFFQIMSRITDDMREQGTVQVQ